MEVMMKSGESGKTALILVGPQGCGKATQARILVKNDGYVHLDMGAYLRGLVEGHAGDPLAKEVHAIMRAGNLLGDDLLCALFERLLLEKGDGQQKIILDGAPRKIPQAKCILQILERAGYSNLRVIRIDIPEHESLARLTKRAQIENRPDDADEQKILRRLSLYETETKPMLHFLKSNSVPVFEVDGVGSVEDIARRIQSVLLHGDPDRI